MLKSVRQAKSAKTTQKSKSRAFGPFFFAEMVSLYFGGFLPYLVSAKMGPAIEKRRHL
jgi:hypothetical protein